MSLPIPHPPSVAPPPRRRWILGVAIGLAAAVVLALCSIPVLGFIGWLYFGPDIKEPKAAAGRYLERIEAGDDAGAYEMLCDRARSNMTAAAFTALIEKNPRPVSHVVTGAWFGTDAGTSANVDVRLTDPTGAARDVDLRMEDDDGSWLVCGETFA